MSERSDAANCGKKSRSYRDRRLTIVCSGSIRRDRKPETFSDYLGENVIGLVKIRENELRNKAKQAMTLKEHDFYKACADTLAGMEKDLDDHWQVLCRQAQRQADGDTEEA